jgi:chromosome segregation ATPase
VLEATREALEEAGHATRERIRELEAQVIAGQQQLQRAQQTAAAVGERSAQIQQELSQAHRELKDQAAAHEEQRQREVERSAANERRLLADVDRARGEARAAQDETKRAHAQRAEQEQAAAAALKQSRQQVADLSQALAAREEELARAQTVIERAGGLEQSLRELAATAQARAQDLHAALESERTTTIELRTRLETQLKGDQGKPQSPVPGSPRRSAVRKKR